MAENSPADRYRSVFRPGLFDGRSVLVTGAGSGIGRCTAHELAALGARVALLGRTPEKLETVAAEIAAAAGPGRTSCHACNIRDEDAVKAAVAEAVQAHGRIDGLVNNAGGQFASRIENMTLKGWEAVIESNLTGGFLVSRECYVQSMREHGGAIVNITADIWGSWPNMAHSMAARAGMTGFGETAAYEWAPSGVRVNAVAPGYIASGGIDRYPPERREFLRGLYKTVPLHRVGTESEVSAAIVFLLSDAAAFITGTTLRVDGGRPQGRVGAEMPAHKRSVPYDGFHLSTQPRVLDGLE